MTAWNKILASVIAKTGNDNTFFRGQPNASWPLLPGLGRLGIVNPKNKEQVLYYDFDNYSGPLLPENRNPWRTIFLMQHHGLPTRLLDWTGSFGVALYFALKGAKGNAAVWILDPYELNKHTVSNQALLSPSDLDSDYEKMFILESAKLDGSVIALAPPRHHARLFSQGGYFTLHRDLDKGLETICPSALTKVEIPRKLFPEAQKFLKLAGINEFSLFPDLDGLCRYIREIDL